MPHSPRTPGSRILVVAPQPFYQDRGTPIAVRQLLEALSELGQEVDLLTFPIGHTVDLPGLRTFRITNPLRIRHVPIGFSLRKLVLDAFLALALWKQLRRERYLCVHALEEAAFPAVVAAHRLGLPVVYDMQSSLPEQLAQHPFFRGRAAQRILRSLERWLLRRADSIVCSAGLAEYVRAVCPTARIREWQFLGQPPYVESEGADDVRRGLEIASHAPIVLYCGNFAPYQGVSRLLDAAPLVLSRVPEAVFVLVGATDDAEPGLPEACAMLCARGALRLVPRQPRTRMASYLAVADVLVSPRDTGSNLPLKVFDYLAAGKPIVAIDSAHHRTVLDESRAVLVDPTPRAIGEAIVRLLLDPLEAGRLGTAAHTFSQVNLGRPAFLELVSAMYPGDRAEPASAAATARPERLARPPSRARAGK